MLPLNLTIGDRRILYSTAEITGIADDAVSFRLTQPQDVIAFKDADIRPAPYYTVVKDMDKQLVVSGRNANIEDHMTVYFNA
jgi:beta-galactosidase